MRINPRLLTGLGQCCLISGPSHSDLGWAMVRDRVVLVTGATGNLGRVTVARFLKEGARVAAVYRSEDRMRNLEEAVGKVPNLKSFKSDVENAESVDAMVKEVLKEYGRIDILLNIVGGWAGGKNVGETTPEEWDDMISLNLRSAFLCSRAVLPGMAERNYGRIVSVAAKHATEKGRPAGNLAYAVSKGGVITLTRGIADEYGKYDINANCVMPSSITDPKAPAGTDQSRRVPAEQIAEVILFLASESSRPVSGAAVPVYGKG